jgi:uncharacterized protein with GYD domain
MPTYLVLWNWTEQGIRNIKEAPKRVEAFRQLVEKNGGKLLSFFFTMGKYDGASIVEAPSDEAFVKIALSVGSLGNVRTTTLKAWPPTEMSQVINQM